jgi:wyosine [tRNA(Phe)-imidazoG37] synthetase (radical SAM superfamily)
MLNVYKYIYGPMPARRQGQALGIDLFRKKICTFDCIYCEVGKTQVFSSNIEAFANPNDVFREIDDFFSKTNDINAITFAGSGEPTLHKNLKEIIIGIKKRVNVPVTVLTNSSLIDKAIVQDALIYADAVLPSLDSARQKTFEKINRPIQGLKVKNIIDGLIQFRKKYTGKIWLEIFFVKNINDTQADIEALCKAIKKIKPDKVQLNTMQRPGTESWSQPLARNDLEDIAKQLPGDVEVIATGEINLT